MAHDSGGSAGTGSARVRAAGWCAAAVMVAAGLGLAISRAGDVPQPRPSDEVQVVSGSPSRVAAPPASLVAAHGSAIQFEVHGIEGGRALIAAHGGAPRSLAVGDRIAGDLVVAEIRRGSVRLREGGRSEQLNLPPRLGGSGEPVPRGQEGLLPEPRPPSGEASGAVIARRMAEARGAGTNGPG